MQYVTLIMLVVGLLMWLLAKGTWTEIGKILFTTACVGIAIAGGPAAVHLFQR